MSGLRRRALLYRIAGTATTLSGASPLLLSNAISRTIFNVVQTGVCTQASSPAGSNVPIYCNNGYISSDNNHDPIVVGNNSKVIVTGKNISYSEPSKRFTGTGQGIKVWEGSFVTDTSLLAKPNVRYTISVDATSSNLTRSSDGALLVLYVDYSDGTTSTFGMNPTSAEQRFSWTTAANKTVTNIRDWTKTARWTGGTISVDNIQIEIGTTATTYQLPRAIQSITNSSNLFSAGTYADTQNITAGSITRNVRVRVLDGTEDSWYLSMSGDIYRYRMKLDDGLYKSGRDANLVCSHFLPAAAGSPVNGCFLNGSSNNEYLFVVPNQKITLLADWKDFLHDELEAGRPVVVVYPLATPTTESCTAQTLYTNYGSNTLLASSEYIDEIDLSATYYANT